MLKSFDILIGFSVVMLITSMAVTVLTQIWTALFNTRGGHLRDGLSDLLNHLHAALGPAGLTAIAHHILTHPLVRDTGNRLGSVIHRDELIRLLLEAASGEGSHCLSDAAKQALILALARNGVPNPGEALQKIRQTALMLESSHPEVSAAVRRDLAILEGAFSEFLAKINGWFDQTMDRVSARFTLTTRRITLINSILVALAIQMDAVSLVNRLAGDDVLRGALVQRAYSEKANSMDLKEISIVASHDLFTIPASPRAWWQAWRFARLPGFVLSVLLLSLGAPFWFEALKNILRLRSAIAGKDDAQRVQRT